MHFVTKAKRFILARPYITGVAVVVLLSGGWLIFGRASAASAQTHYVLGSAATGTVVASISESGQVASSNTLALTPQVSGQILYIGVTPGQKVAQGTLIAEIDPTTAQKNLRDAEANLKSAQLSLQKLQEPATALSVAQAEDAVTSATQSLSTAYSGSATDLANTFLDLPTVLTGLQDIDFGTESNTTQQWNIDWYENAASKYDQVDATAYRDQAYQAYSTAKSSYDQTFADYQKVNIASADATTTEHLLTETYNTLGLVINAVKATNSLIQFYSDKVTAQNLTPIALSTTQLTNLASYTGKLATHYSTLYADTSSLAGDKQSLDEKQLSLAQLEQGSDTIDLASAELNVEKAQNTVADANATLAEYYMRAPFAGTIGSVSASAYAQASSGTTIATLVTSQQYAQLSINEVDAAKIAVGDKATLTFDAIDGLTLTGTVASIDQVGTVSQGVVSYDLKVGFDSQDKAIKPGMTVNAAIQTGVAQDVLVVPQSAVKTQNGQSYVLAFDPPLDDATVAAAGAQGVVSATAPVQLPVTTGLSDDTSVEITSGLTAGQQIVVSTKSGTLTKASAAAPAASARGFGGGGGIRIGG